MEYEAYDTGSTRFAGNNIYVNSVDVSVREPYHAHNFIEIVIIRSGSGMHIANGEKFNVSAGDVIVIDYDTPHKSLAGAEGMTVINCLFTPEYLDPRGADIRSFSGTLRLCGIDNAAAEDFSHYLCITPRGSLKYRILTLAETMLEEFSKKSDCYNTFLRGGMFELISLISRCAADSGSRGYKVADIVKEYILANYSGNIHLDELASMVYLSEQHLCRLFKNSAGLTIIQFLQRVRIDAAMGLVLTTDKKISEIASLVGYSDLKHFNSVFKKITGTSPSKLRADSRKSIRQQ